MGVANTEHTSHARQYSKPGTPHSKHRGEAEAQEDAGPSPQSPREEPGVHSGPSLFPTPSPRHKVGASPSYHGGFLQDPTLPWSRAGAGPGAWSERVEQAFPCGDGGIGGKSCELSKQCPLKSPSLSLLMALMPGSHLWADRTLRSQSCRQESMRPWQPFSRVCSIHVIGHVTSDNSTFIHSINSH